MIQRWNITSSRKQCKIQERDLSWARYRPWVVSLSFPRPTSQNIMWVFRVGTVKKVFFFFNLDTLSHKYMYNKVKVYSLRKHSSINSLGYKILISASDILAMKNKTKLYPSCKENVQACRILEILMILEFWGAPWFPFWQDPRMKFVLFCIHLIEIYSSFFA